MDIQGYQKLFNSIYPDFFESESVRSMSDDMIFDEMLLPLNEFDYQMYDKTQPDNISFGFYDGEFNIIKEAVEKVERDWVEFFDGNNRIYCGYADGKIASFCLVDNMGVHLINGNKLKIGGPGCVGTVPEYRNRGIGLTMVRNATQILKEEGYDYSYIHFTGVVSWYEKLGYKTSVKWNKNGFVQK